MEHGENVNMIKYNPAIGSGEVFDILLPDAIGINDSVGFNWICCRLSKIALNGVGFYWVQMDFIELY